MLKKETGVKWTLEAKQLFDQVKLALTQTPVLISPDFTKDFYIFSFASEYTIKALHQEALNIEPRTLIHHHPREKKIPPQNVCIK